jgi:hypothetical protein
VARAYHNWDKMRSCLFGWEEHQVKVQSVWANDRQAALTNDLWMALAPYYGLTDYHARRQRPAPPPRSRACFGRLD